jgi:hypothetical protein
MYGNHVASHFDIQLAAEFSALMEDLYGMTSRDDIRGASTDFVCFPFWKILDRNTDRSDIQGNVTYGKSSLSFVPALFNTPHSELPAFHPLYGHFPLLIPISKC